LLLIADFSINTLKNIYYHNGSTQLLLFMPCD